MKYLFLFLAFCTLTFAAKPAFSDDPTASTAGIINQPVAVSNAGVGGEVAPANNGQGICLVNQPLDSANINCPMVCVATSGAPDCRPRCKADALKEGVVVKANGDSLEKAE